MARKAVQRLTPEQQVQRKKRTILLACLGAVALVLLVALVTYLRVRGGPALPPEIERRLAQERSQSQQPGSGQPGAQAPAPGQPPADLVPAGTPPLKQQLANLEYAGRSGDTRPQTLYVTDAELNDILGGSLRNDPKIRTVRAYFGSGRAYIVAVGDFHGNDINVTVAANPVIVNGGVQFGVESVRIGSMAAPEAVFSKIQQEAMKNSDKLSPQRTGLYVDRIDIRNGVAILSGRAVPKTQ